MTVHALYWRYRADGFTAIMAWHRAHLAPDGSHMSAKLDRECGRILAWSRAHPIVKVGKTPDCIRSMAFIRNLKVDRSSGYLRTIRPGKRKPSNVVELRRLLNDALAHIEASDDPDMKAWIGQAKAAIAA